MQGVYLGSIEKGLRMRRKWIWVILSLSIFLTGCTGGIVNYSSCPRCIDPCSKIAVVPFSNHTETPLAGERAMSITASLLASRGFCNMSVYQNRYQGKILFPGMNQVVPQDALLDWARGTCANYMMTGTVNEWTYKVGLDGEPVVGISLELIDLNSGAIVWTAVGSQSGGSRLAVSTVGQQLINCLLEGLSASHRKYVY